MSHFWITELFGYPVHFNTLIMAWAAMAVILFVAFSITMDLKVIPARGQVIGEGIYDLCRSVTMSTAGPRGDGYLFYIGSIFLFILVANLMGQLPLKLISLPHGELIAATGDFSVPAALAVMTVLTYFAVGISTKGMGYFKHYLSPHPLFLPLNILEDFTRPGSLTLRLYFNILVGEILTGIAYSFAPVGPPVFVSLMEIFVACVQAYIFTILSAVYIGLLSEDHDHH